MNHRPMPRWLVLTCLLLLGSPALSSPGPQPAELIEAIDAASLDPAAAVVVKGLQLNLGVGRLDLNDGALFPASPLAGRVVEMVFIGDGAITMETVDEIEQGQLELFTGAPALDEPIREAVFVVCMDAAADALLGRPAAGEIDPADAERAQLLYNAWRKGSERKLLDVRTAILMDALGDPFYASYFAGRFHSEDLGEFVVVIEPDAEEQVTVAQFQRLTDDDSQKEQRKRKRALHRAQSRGRFVGVDLEDLGDWDTWFSSTLRTPAGEPFAGLQGIEPRHYELDVSIDESGRELTGVARLHLAATVDGRRVVRLSLHRDFRVERVRDGRGRDLFFTQESRNTYVVLPEPLLAGEELRLEVEYRGVALTKLKSNVFSLRETRFWYPHAGDADRATYDVKLSWPAKLDLVAGGKLEESGRQGEARRWERRTIGVPCSGYSFELGRFDVRGRVVGHVDVRVAFDRWASKASEELQEEILDTVAGSLEFYEEVFGPYPLDHLTVVTVPREFSQGMLGFVSLSTLISYDLGWIAAVLGLEDRRTVVAHEIAHQWWGNLVGWRGYRDQWISEAMANYAAMVWAKRKLPEDDRPRHGPESGWMRILSLSTEDGRSLESLGPLVMGVRLSSSRSPGAYEAIVYKKGAVVLNMLSNAFGEDAFLQALQILVEAASNKIITTEDFVSVLQQVSGFDLSWFAKQYIYGTGLPEVYYTYEFEPAAAGTWIVHVVARQQTPYHYQHDVVATPGGSFDARVRATARIDTEDSALVVPFQVAVYDPAAKPKEDDGEKKRGRRGKRDGEKKKGKSNSTLNGRLILTKQRNEIDLEIGYEPEEFWLDGEGKVFGRFFSEDRAPKRVLMFQGMDSVAEGRLDEAEDLFLAALAAEMYKEDDEDEEDAERKQKSNAERRLDAQIHLRLASIHLDRDRVADARREVESAREELKGLGPRLMRESIRILESRCDLREGHADRAFRRLRKEVRGRNRMASTGGYVVLAIAARAVGETKVFERAVEEATGRGADLSALTGGS